jgi:NADH-quinone oxidoreductase subunit G
MPKLTINGQEIEFKEGQTIIEAAQDSDIEIPHFCWHPALSVSGNCRMCLVEVEKMPKLVIACATLASDGMEVKVNSDKALQARNAVMEFLLINHPLDCPICDEAGECKLQDYAYEHGMGESRFEEMKNRKEKRVDLGPRIKFDGERCISCSRCIRFSDEIAGQNQLTFVKRGDRVTIRTFPGEEFDNNYTLNTVDICPVGALTSRDFRFKARVWDMSSTKSICTGCARGCNTEVWVRNNEIHRLTPRENHKVNDFWMCDYGRLNTFKFVNAENRIDGPSMKNNGAQVKASWEDAYTEVVNKFKQYKKGEIAFIGSGHTACEDNYVLTRFAKEVFNSNKLNSADHIVPDGDDGILLKADRTPNSQGAELVGAKNSEEENSIDNIIKGINEGKIKALYIVEDDIASISEEYEKALTKLEFLVVNATNENKTTPHADVVFPASTFAEKNGTFVNFEGHLQRFYPSVTTKEMDRALEGMSMSRLDKFGTKFDKWAGTQKKHDARPSWRIISDLAGRMGKKMNYKMAEEVFDDIAEKIEKFKGLDYDEIGELGINLNTREKEQEKHYNKSYWRY